MKRKGNVARLHVEDGSKLDVWLNKQILNVEFDLTSLIFLGIFWQINGKVTVNFSLYFVKRKSIVMFQGFMCKMKLNWVVG